MTTIIVGSVPLAAEGSRVGRLPVLRRFPPPHLHLLAVVVRSAFVLCAAAEHRLSVGSGRREAESSASRYHCLAEGQRR